MAIILISQGFRGVDFLRKPSVYLHFKAFFFVTVVFFVVERFFQE